jgi:hypothetical protein
MARLQEDEGRLQVRRHSKGTAKNGRARDRTPTLGLAKVML